MQTTVKSVSKRTRVSVLINNYNYAPYLSYAIDSVLSQTYDNFELIIVDDGSTDASAELIRRYASNDDRIIPVLKENGGQASAFNAGISTASGDIICFLDSDDTWYPNKIETVVRAHCDHDFIQHDLSRYEHPRFSKEGFLFDRTRIVREFGYLYVFSTTSALSVTSKLAKNIFPIPEKEFRLCADLFVMLTATYLSGVHTLPDVLGCHRIHENNFWAKRKFRRHDRELMYQSTLEIVNRWLFAGGYYPIPSYTRLMRRRFWKHVLGIDASINCFVYGTGSMAEELTEIIEEEGATIRGYVDTLKSDDNNTFMGQAITSPLKMKALMKDGEIVIIGSSFVQPILHVLESINVDPARIRYVPKFNRGRNRIILCGDNSDIENALDAWPGNYPPIDYLCPMGDSTDLKVARSYKRISLDHFSNNYQLDWYFVLAGKQHKKWLFRQFEEMGYKRYHHYATIEEACNYGIRQKPTI